MVTDRKRSIPTAIGRRDVLEMLRHENELLKARNQKVDSHLTRHKQAFRALIRMDETMQAMRPGFSITALIRDLLTLALHASDSENGSMILVDETSDELEFVEVIGDARKQLLNHRIGIETGIVGHVIKTQKAMLVNDVHNSSKWSAEVDRVIGFNTNALMCAPLLGKEKIYGAIEVVNTMTGHEFDESDLAIMRVTARFVSHALRDAEDLTIGEGGVV